MKDMRPVKIGKKGSDRIVEIFKKIGIVSENIKVLSNKHYKNGDICIKIKLENYYFELKTITGKSKSLNQIRPYFNLPIIVITDNGCFLLSAKTVNKIIVKRERGQHNNDKWGSSHLSFVKKNFYNSICLETISLECLINWLKENYISNDLREEIIKEFDMIDKETNFKKEEILKNKNLI